jgi:hypothetical protein
MTENEALHLTVRIMVEHGQATLSDDPSDEETSMIKINPEMSNLSLDEMIDAFVSRYPATLYYLRRLWSEMH